MLLGQFEDYFCVQKWTPAQLSIAKPFSASMDTMLALRLADDCAA